MKDNRVFPEKLVRTCVSSLVPPDMLLAGDPDAIQTFLGCMRTNTAVPDSVMKKVCLIKNIGERWTMNLLEGGLFRNKKKGTLYKILYIATDTTNERDGLLVVVYTCKETGKVFVRELKEFREKFDVV